MNKWRGVGDGRRSRAKGFVFKEGGVWCLAVMDSRTKTIVTDDACDWRNIFDTAFLHVGAVRDIENIGHELVRPYDYLVRMEAERNA